MACCVSSAGGIFCVAGKNPLAMRETWFDPQVGEIPWRRERLPTPVFLPGEPKHSQTHPQWC